LGAVQALTVQPPGRPAAAGRPAGAGSGSAIRPGHRPERRCPARPIVAPAALAWTKTASTCAGRARS